MSRGLTNKPEITIIIIMYSSSSLLFNSAQFYFLFTFVCGTCNNRIANNDCEELEAADIYFMNCESYARFSHL